MFSFFIFLKFIFQESSLSVYDGGVDTCVIFRYNKMRHGLQMRLIRVETYWLLKNQTVNYFFISGSLDRNLGIRMVMYVIQMQKRFEGVIYVNDTICFS